MRHDTRAFQDDDKNVNYSPPISYGAIFNNSTTQPSPTQMRTLIFILILSFVPVFVASLARFSNRPPTTNKKTQNKNE